MFSGKKTKKKSVINPTEDYEQTRTVVYLQRRCIPVFAIPNGGSRNLLEAVKLKRTGVSAGVPDLCVPMARSGYHGLFLELKRLKGGKISENQQYWIDVLRAQGYKCEVCPGFEAAKLVIDEYFR